MSTHYDVIIVGAGITGASTAYHLKQFGVKRVALIERGQPASGGTGKSAAIVRQHYSTPIMARLARDSVDMFAAMRQELGADGGYVNSGYCFLLTAEMLPGARKNVAMQQGLGIDTRFLDDQERDQRMPWLNTEGVAGVVYEKRGGYADPVQTTEAYVGAFQKQGGEVRLKTPVRELTRDGDRITGVILDDGRLAAGAVVNAAGPWAKYLAESARLELQMRSIREQDLVWQARQGRPVPNMSVSNGVDAIYLRPLGDGRFILGRGFPKPYTDVDPYNYKETADDDFIAEVQERAERRFPPLAGMKLLQHYSALYDVTPDWYPYIGPRTGIQGYYDGSGGSGHGFKIGPAIGKELARWIATGEVAEDFAPLTYDRLAAGRLYNQSFGGNRG
ncbi:MAG: FAD-binding oxidoreductase [Alphaproteobacteria bacterium]|nr:FAD-binding oxidoreductase [Alphaproteobacteria bacterium]